MPATSRLHALDGLRGLAAVIVLFHHALLTIGPISRLYAVEAASVESPILRLLAYTPLHIVWAGNESVYLFFVLSGFVLVLPVLRAGRHFSWLSYYPRRIIRIHVPVIAAIALAGVCYALVPRFDDPGLSDWVNISPDVFPLDRMVRNAVLVLGVSPHVSPLWSLQWEMLFSLLLPVFVVIAIASPRFWTGKVALVLIAIAAGPWLGYQELLYLPMFAVGALIAVRWEEISLLAPRLDRRPWAWPAVLVLAVVLTTSTWVLDGLGAVDAQIRFAWLSVVGVSILLIAAVHYRPFRRMLERRFFAWLGRISFSLYLVHEPIVITVRLALFPQPAWIAILVSVPLSLLVAVLFARFVEGPAHELAKRVGSHVSKREAVLTP